MKTRIALLIASSALVFVESAALAQTARAGSLDQNPDSAESEGPVQSGNMIVVTASKRAETVQDTSLAVTAIGGDELRTQNISDLEGLQASAPSLTIGDDNGVAKIFMRGIGLNTSTNAAEAGVALHVDGAIVSRPEAQLASFYDLERAEVVRGPQGTLYGRNAVGGAINLITSKPTFSPEGYVEATYGNYNRFETSGAISGPITDTLAARLAFRSEDRDGFGVFVGNGSDVDDNNRQMARAQLLFEPSPKLSWLLSGEWFNQSDASGAPHRGGLAYPGTVFVPTGVGGYATNPRDSAGDFAPYYDAWTWSVTNTLNYEASDWLSITNISNYREFSEIHGYDYDVSMVQNHPLQTGRANATHQKSSWSEHFSNDLQFQISTDFVDGVVGLFYFKENLGSIVRYGLGNKNSSFGPPQNADGVIASGVNHAALLESCLLTEKFASSQQTILTAPNLCAVADHSTTAVAAYGQFMFNMGMFSDSLSGVAIKLGGRFNRERREVNNYGSVSSPTSSRIIAPGIASRTYKDFTPEVGFEWEVTDDLLAYYTYSEGFKSGVGEPYSPGTSRLIDPETIQNHEIGLKSTFLDGRGSVNLAAFTYNMQGLQIQRTRPFGNSPNDPPVQLFENATGVEAKGVEIDMRFAPVEAVRFAAGVAYLDSKFTDFVTTDNLNPAIVVGPTNNGGPNPFVDLAGNPTRNSPKWSGSGSIEVDLLTSGLPGGGTLTGRVDAFYRSDTFYTEYARFLEGQPGFATFDLALRYDARPFRASIWVKNVTDKLAVNGAYASTVNGIIGQTYFPPRTYGATVGFEF